MLINFCYVLFLCDIIVFINDVIAENLITHNGFLTCFCFINGACNFCSLIKKIDYTGRLRLHKCTEVLADPEMIWPGNVG